MRVDVTKYEPGVALSHRLVVSKCPRCGLGGVCKRTRRGARFVHAIGIMPVTDKEGRVKRGRQKAVEVKCSLCKFTASQWRAVEA